MTGVVLLVRKKWLKIAKIRLILLQKAPKGCFLTIFRAKMAKIYGLKDGEWDFSLSHTLNLIRIN